MEGTVLTLACLGGAALLVVGAWAYWRYVWFWRNPPRKVPSGSNVVSPADGTVVYVARFDPRAEVISIKQGVEARITDIVREDMDRERVLIGIFMSPFSVHYNRAPIDATVDFIRHHPAQPENLPMRSMHFRTIVGCKPLYRNSMHIVQNERTVTRFDGHWNGERVPAYVVQIGGWSVNGIDSYFGPGESVRKGEIFGMIRIGSQVDLVLPDRDDMELCVEPGQKVRAGETILLRARQPEPDKRLAPENAGVTTS